MNKTVAKIWAHRGASGYAPENTIEAFEKAAAMKADGVELDVQLTKDGEIVVIHDETVARVSGAEGYVRDYTLKEIQALDVSLPMKPYRRTRIPALWEVLEILKPTEMEVNIELKTGIYFYPGLEEKLVRLVKALGMTERVWCSSFNHSSACRVRELCPEIRCGFLISDVMMDAAAYARHYQMQALHPALYHLQDHKLIENVKRQGLSLHVWTVNEEADMDSLMRAGVDAIITNYPDKAVKIRDMGIS